MNIYANRLLHFIGFRLCFLYMEPHDFLISVGEIIRTRRKALRFSQERLAELADMHPTYISEIERGKVNASIYCFQNLTQALGIELADLLYLPTSRIDRALEYDIKQLTSQIRQLDREKRKLVLDAIRGMLAGLLE